MKIRRILMLAVLIVAMTGLPWGGDNSLAQSKSDKGAVPAGQTKGRLRGTTMAQRYAAASRKAAARAEGIAQGRKLTMAVPVPGRDAGLFRYLSRTTRTARSEYGSSWIRCPVSARPTPITSGSTFPSPWR